MKYNVSDSDVKAYLAELKKTSLSISSSLVSGSANFAIILEQINSNLYDITQRAKEQQTFLLARYARSSKILEASQDKVKKTNNLDLRYQFHKSIQSSLKTKSNFIAITNGHIDTDLRNSISQINEYKREVAEIAQQLSDIQELLNYFNSMSQQLPQLIELSKKA